MDEDCISEISGADAEVSAIAGRHGRMVEIAILKANREMAMAAVDSAFAEITARDGPPKMDDPVESLVRVRIATILRGGGVETIGQLCEHSRDSLAAIHQLRYRSVDLIIEALRRHGLQLRQ